MATDFKRKQCNRALFRIVLLLLAISFTQTFQAQVTIGSDIPPQKGALLDIKTQPTDVSNLISSSGGIILPRVKLIAINTLEPFIATDAPDLDALKKSHVGLTVYNLRNTAPFVPGLYVWNGQQWMRGGTGGSASVNAQNGLYIDPSQGNDMLKLGGSLLKETTIAQSDKNIGFTTGTSGEWRVNSKDFIVFGDNSVGIGDDSHPANTQLLVGGNTNMDGKITVDGTSYLKGNTTIDGSFRYNYDNGNHAGQYLMASDDSGTAEWATPRVGAEATVTGTAVGGGNQAYSFNSTNQYSTNQYILLPPGKWMVTFTILMRRASSATHQKCWVTLGFARRSNYTSSTVANYEPYDKYKDINNPVWPVYIESVLDASYDYTAVSGIVVIDNFAVPGGANPSGGTYPNNGFNNTTDQLSRFDLIVIKNGEGLRPGSNSSWNWTSGNLQLNGGASENVIVAIKID